MNLTAQTQVRARPSVAQWVIALAGLSYLLVGLAQLFAPRWFFDNIGNFPPFNRHYLGDLGAFISAIGLGLLMAARDPRKHRLLIGAAAAGSLLHVVNHLYDDWLSAQWSVDHALTQTLPLLGLALALTTVWYELNRSD